MSTEDRNLHHSEPEIDELTQDRYLGGHEYDGIRELDNRMPRWWLYLFYATIVFAAVYMIGYHVLPEGSRWASQEVEYEKEIAAAALIMPADPHASIDLASLVPMTEQADLAAGEEIYIKICVTCHGKFAEGLVGPNMTDPYWIHGDTTSNTITVKDLYNVMITGVIEKGMISYKDQLSPEQMQQVIGFIFSLQGTNPPKAKQPEGHKYDIIG
ncbi:MAG: cytochrome C [Bacteroidetes bacterium HGW-Bacteroidetes-11]|jgi:cytochrome c oxidase cbb3-type subunit 3|nr:MAG: cytochrome C [Bacteroidetes bacterium HGW-Bacteroidetes-11]